MTETVPNSDPTVHMTAGERVLYKLDRVTDSDAVTLDKLDLREALTSWHDAGLDVYWTWDRFKVASTPLDQAEALTAMSNAMSDLATYLPGYDYERGEIVDEDEPQ